MKNLVLVDDHEMMRLGIKTYVETNSDWKVTGSFGNTEECLNFLCNFDFSDDENIPCAIVDVDLGEESGFELVNKITRQFPKVKCIMYSMHEEASLVSKALESGAKGYVSKASKIEEFLVCLEKIHSGESYTKLNSTAAEDRIQWIKKFLTPREQSILKLVLDYKSNEEIAEELNIKKHSVEIYVARIYEKAMVKDHSELLKKFN